MTTSGMHRCLFEGRHLVSITIVQHLRSDYCENFKLAGKESIDKLKWNISSCFKKYRQYLSKHWQPSCSIRSKCSNVMP